jgi:chromosome partitioning protein
MPKKIHLAPVVAVINMKGGVGKTTISAHLFRLMFKVLQAGTLILDLDPQFNLTQTLFNRTQYEKFKSEGKTIFKALEPLPPAGLFKITTTSDPPPSPMEIGRILRYFKYPHSVEQLVLVPGDFSLVKYNLMGDRKQLDAVRMRFQQFVNQARLQFKIICIDCNPSSSFLTLCALQACTHLLVPVRPDRYSVLGLEMILEFLHSIPSINPKPKIIIILNGVRRHQPIPKVEEELRAHEVFGSLTLANRIYESRLLAASPDYTGFATDKPVSNKNRLTKELRLVVDELSERLGLRP